MLTPLEKNAIEAAAAAYPHRDAARVEALKIVQRQRGWISDEALCDIAALLGATPAEMEDVATFYTYIFRHPVGAHMILVCDSVTCWAMGYHRVLEHLRARLGIGLGETSADGRFTILPAACLGACDHAPVMLVDGQLYGDLDEVGIDSILQSLGLEIPDGKQAKATLDTERLADGPPPD